MSFIPKPLSLTVTRRRLSSFAAFWSTKSSITTRTRFWRKHVFFESPVLASLADGEHASTALSTSSLMI